ncbi:MAG: hypothetical protein K0B87_00555 [Candidatus Syntrophosphaera sp.]|nr:hypothetical protein [Candidatus Syntrophosphaera sp.]
MFSVKTEKIMASEFDSKGFVELIEFLLVLEMTNNKILLSDLQLCSASKKDGGIDALVLDAGKQTDHIKSPHTVYQFKAGRFDTPANVNKSLRPFPTKTEQENLKSVKENKFGLKKRLNDLLNNGAHFIWVIKYEYPSTTISSIIESTHEVIKKYYNSKYPKNRIKVVEANAVCRWVNKDFLAVQYVNWVLGKSLFADILPYNIWRTSISDVGLLSSSYIECGTLSEWKDEIIKFLNDDNTTNLCVISGLSGIGKTHFVVNAIDSYLSSLDPSQSRKEGKRIIWINRQSTITPFDEVKKLLSKHNHLVFIIENCGLEEAYPLKRIADQTSGNNKIIIISSEADSTHNEFKGCLKLHIRPEVCLQAVKMYIDNNPLLSASDKFRIEDYSSGFVFFAQLIVQSISSMRKSGSRGNILDIDEDVPRKILKNIYGSDLERAIFVLQVCALFSFFGFYDDSNQPEIKEQREFLANTLVIFNENVPDRSQIFWETCNRGLAKGIFDVRGRYISLRPKPLALYLAKDYIARLQPADQDSLFEKIEKVGLMDSFCKQIKLFAGLNQIEVIIEKLVNSKFSPFSADNILLTERGARVFLSICEVHPQLCLNVMNQTFSRLSDEEIRSLDTIRRYIVLSLEKLVFSREFSDESIRVLYKLALGENEPYANNATGILANLFHIFLPGTEASLEDRMRLISEWYEEADDATLPLILKILEESIRVRYFTRSCGAEYIGGQLSKIDYRPTTLEEIEDYIANSLSILRKVMITSKDAYKEQAINIVLNGLSNLICAGYWESFLNVFMEQEWNSDNIIKLQSVLNTAMKFNYFKNPLHRDSAIRYVESLYDNEYKMRIVCTVVTPEYETEDKSNTTESQIEGLVNDLIKDKIRVTNYLGLLFDPMAREAYYFGRMLSNRQYQVHDVLDSSLEFIKTNTNVNLGFVIGVLSECGHQDKTNFIENLVSQDPLNKYALTIVTKIKASMDDIYSLFTIVDIKPEMIKEFVFFKYGRATEHLSIPDRLLFYERLCSYGIIGKQITLMICYMDIFVNKKIYRSYRDFITPLLLDKELLEYTTFIEDVLYDWSSLAVIHLKDSPSNSSKIAKLVFQAYIELYQKDVRTIDSCHEIFSLLYESFFDDFWNEFTKLLVKKDSLLQLRLKHSFGWTAGEGISSNLIGMTNEDKILSWCKKKGLSGATHVINIIPLYEKQNESIQWTSLAISLIRDYWQSEDFRNSLFSNLGSAFTIGSGVSYVRLQIELLKKLKEENSIKDRSWINSSISMLEKQADRMQMTYEERYINY